MFSTKRVSVILGLVLVVAVGASAKKKNQSHVPMVPSGSKIFIAPMQGNLDGFIAPELIKQKVPITVVLNEPDADYILVGLSMKEDTKWYNFAFGAVKDQNECNVKLIKVQGKSMVWAGEAGDRSLWYGPLRRGGQRKLADRIVKQMKQDCF